MQVMSSLYTQNLNFSPARAISPAVRTNSDVESQYLTELIAEGQKLVPFMQALPICSRLLNQEILRVSGMMSDQSINDYDRLLRGSPNHVASLDIIQNVGAKGLGVFPSSPQPEWLGGPNGMAIDWKPACGSPSSYVVKRVMRLDIPVDRFPYFNFVGRLLGPRGNSLKRVEASTGCRVFIRGKGSIKDSDKEESLRGRQGYEHLNDPLHVLIEAELPVNIIAVRMKQAREIIEELLKPVDESRDLYKRQQLRELAMLNNSFKEESPQPRGSLSPFSSSAMKRAKTGWTIYGRVKPHGFPLWIQITYMGMIKLIQGSTMTLIDSWNNIIEAKGGIADIKIDQLSGDVISKACFGSNYSRGEEIFKLRALQECTSKKGLNVGIPGMRYLPTKSNREAWALERDIKTLILKVVKERN